MTPYLLGVELFAPRCIVEVFLVILWDSPFVAILTMCAAFFDMLMLKIVLHILHLRHVGGANPVMMKLLSL